MGCTPAGDCRGLCVMHRSCCITGKWRLQVVRPGFETAPGLSGVVFFPKLRFSSGFQTLGLPCGLLTATFVGWRHRPARNWVGFLPRKVASLAGLCTPFSVMFTISIAQISIWIWAQLKEVGLKEPCCWLGAQPLNTIHIWPRSRTAPQPDGLDWESILRREETGVPGENPRSQVEIDWNSIHIQHL